MTEFFKINFDGERVPMDPDDAASLVEPIAELKVRKIAAIKAEANRRILAIMPEHEQRNSLALGMEMIAAHGADPDGWPDAERQIYGAVMSRWALIKAIRAYSNDLEIQVNSKLKRHTLEAIDITAGWPE